MNKIKFLVVSDLHATVSEEYKNDSRLMFNPTTNECEHAQAFIDYVKELNINIDYLVCPGDISNKGDTKGFKAGWKFLNDLKTEIQAEELLCVPGNHDHQSRPGTSYSVIHELKFVKPPFPTSDHSKNTNFWGWYWLHQEYNDFNVIKLNSSAYHGLNDEFKHGRVAIETSDQISEYITDSSLFKEKKFNILLCHHHPMPMDEVDGELDKEVMDGGTNLLKKLEEADVGPWLVIHGHKHFASLSYGMTHSSCPPVLFSAGSLGALLYPQIKERTANQFYILTIDINQTESTGRLVGQFESYSWNNMRGWHPSQSDFLPYKGGFGSQVTPHTLVIEILKLLESTPYLDKNDLVNIQDKIDYYTPSQFKELLGKMDKKGLFVDYDGNQIKEVVNNEKSNN